MHLPDAHAAALERILAVLEAAGFEAMLVGALATFAWGEPRTTRDLDVALRLRGRDPAEVRRALSGVGAEVQGPFSTEFGPRFILPFKGGLPVDVFLAAESEAPAFARRRRVVAEGRTFWVVAPEDLVLAKLRNAMRFPEERLQDGRDAAGVLFRQWPAFDFGHARERCRTLHVCGAFEALVDETREARRRAGLPT